MPTKFITTGATYTSTGTTSTSAFQIPDFYYQPTNTVGYYIEGTDSTDYLWGSAKDDTMHGYAGNDLLYGQGGNDTIFGENGNDQLFGDFGNDRLDGGNDNDLLEGGAGADILIGGAGIDTASYLNSSGPVTVQLASGGSGADAQGDTYSGIENVIGSAYADTIIGDANDNRLEGGDGDDTIIGGSGRDVIIGGKGSDILWGDSAGVSGNDIFIVENRSGNDVYFFDTIMDFGYGDKLHLKGFSISDLGADGELATVDTYDDGTIRGDDIEASDKLFYGVLDDKLYYADIQQRDDGFWYMANRQVVADFSDLTSIHTYDLVFV
jgi:Ca2+-binding RTX toxin-like protein